MHFQCSKNLHSLDRLLNSLKSKTQWTQVPCLASFEPGQILLRLQITPQATTARPTPRQAIQPETSKDGAATAHEHVEYASKLYSHPSLTVCGRHFWGAIPPRRTNPKMPSSVASFRLANAKDLRSTSIEAVSRRGAKRHLCAIATSSSAQHVVSATVLSASRGRDV